MLGIGWTEMLVIGVVALIFIGPKDLPVVMGRIGKVIGQVQRMGREFQREINKATGLDEVRNLRTSITAPLKKTADEIRKDFNAIGKDGKESPTGVLKPTDPNTESVVEAIQQQAGITPAKKSNDELAAEYGFTSNAEAAKAEPVKAARAKPAATKSTSAKPAAAKALPADAEVNKATAKPASKARSATGKPTASKTAKAAAGEATPVKAKSAKAAEPGATPPVAAKPKASTSKASPPKASASKPAVAKAPEATVEADAKSPAKPRASRKKPADTAGKSE